MLAVLVSIVACTAGQDGRQETPRPSAAAPAPGSLGVEPARPPRASPPESKAPVVLFVGTSLTAGFGLPVEQAFPARIQELMGAQGFAYHVVNAGVSGETSAGALRRMDWLLSQPVAVLVLETGANDGLRGQDVEATRANIQAIFDRVRRVSPPPKVLLLGMEAPPNLGPEYGKHFHGIFPDLARKNQAAVVPFLLEGVAGLADLNQADGIHPTAEGHQRLAETVWKALKPLLTPAPGAAR